jgi:hypothetical protein
MRRFEQLGVVPVGASLPELVPVDIEPRALQSPELLPSIAGESEAE